MTHVITRHINAKTFPATSCLQQIFCKVTGKRSRWISHRQKLIMGDASKSSRTVKGFPDYCISESGVISRSAAFKNRPEGSVVRHRVERGGYAIIGLYKDGKQITRTVHSLVAETFLGEPPTENHEVAHADGNRLNNCLLNLRWATRAENHYDKRLHGTALVGVKNPAAKLDEDKVKTIRELKNSRKISNQALGDMFGVTKVAIRYVLCRRTWSHV